MNPIEELKKRDVEIVKEFYEKALKLVRLPGARSVMHAYYLEARDNILDH